MPGQAKGFTNTLVGGKETTYGTKASTLKWLGLISEFGVEQSNNSDSRRSLGKRAPVMIRQGGVSTEFSITGGVQNPILMYYALGKVTTVGASAPYTHTMTLAQEADVMPSFTLQNNMPNIPFCRNLLGCKVDTMTLTASANEALEIEIEGMAQKVLEELTPATVTADVTTNYFMFYEGTIKLNTVLNANITEFEVELSNGLESRFTLNGDKFPVRIEEGSSEVTGSFTMDFMDKDAYTAFLAGTKVDIELIFTDSANPTGHTFTLTLPQCVYDSAELSPEAEDLTEIEIEFISTGMSIVYKSSLPTPF